LWIAVTALGITTMASAHDERMESLFRLGFEQLSQGKPSEATESFTKFLNNELNHAEIRPRALIGRTRAFLQLKSLNQAKSDLRSLSDLLAGRSDRFANDKTELVQLQTVYKECEDTLSIAQWLNRLAEKIGRAKFKNGLTVLNKAGTSLYSEVGETVIAGVVSCGGQLFACGVGDQTGFGCVSSMGDNCKGQSGGVCKHLMALLLGLISVNKITARHVFNLLENTSSPRMTKVELTPLIVRYRRSQNGAEEWISFEHSRSEIACWKKEGVFRDA
jgi:hypothetical protein